MVRLRKLYLVKSHRETRSLSATVCRVGAERRQQVPGLRHLADSEGEAAVEPELQPQAGEVDNMSTTLPADIVIRLERIHKTYSLGDIEVHALRGVSLEIRRGEFAAIMGPSGSGKSTMMNIIGCLDRPTKGQYLLEGSDVSKVDKAGLADIRNKRIGFVFQSFNLVPRTSALENVELPLVYAGVAAAERTRRARAALAEVGLADRERNMPNQLSGGQQQRVALARALVNNPSLILADEPTGALDTRRSVEAMGIFQRLKRERNLRVIRGTHEPDSAQYVNRTIQFRDGRIRRDSPVENRKDAGQVLMQLPAEKDDEEDEVL